MIHVQRGGASKTSRDREHRLIPLHPRAAELLPPPQEQGPVFGPEISERRLLQRLKVLCHECGFPNPRQYKLHSFRHHFASLCANHQIAYRKALAWLGHSSSAMLDLYYHLHDEDSQRAMLALASTAEESFEGNLRATGQSKIEKTLQVPEVKELLTCLARETERAGFSVASNR